MAFSSISYLYEFKAKFIYKIKVKGAIIFQMCTEYSGPRAAHDLLMPSVPLSKGSRRPPDGTFAFV